jgi:hypothetical protein
LVHQDAGILLSVTALVDDTFEELATFEQLHYQEDLILGLVDLVETDSDLVFDDPLDVDLLGNRLLGIKYY